MLILPLGSQSAVRSLAFSPDGTRLASGSEHGRLVVWDLDTREIAMTFPKEVRKVCSLAFSPDGELLAGCGAGGRLWVWRLAKPKTPIREERFAYTTPAPARVCFSPDNTLVATTLADSLVSLSRGQQVNLLSAQRQADDPRPRTLATGQRLGLTDLAFSPDGTRLAIGCFDRHVSVWNLESRTQAFLLEHGQKIHYLAFSPDGSTLAAGNPQGCVKLWETDTGRKRLTLKGQTTPLRALCYSPNGKVIVTAGGEGIVTFWDVQSGKSRTAFDWGIGEVHSVAFASDGMRAAAGGMGQVVIWDIDDWGV